MSGLDLSPFLGIGKTWACFHEVGNVPRLLESWNSLLRIGASSGAQVLRTIAVIPSGHLDLEVSSWRKVWRTLRVENLMGDSEF